MKSYIVPYNHARFYFCTPHKPKKKEKDVYMKAELILPVEKFEKWKHACHMEW